VIRFALALIALCFATCARAQSPVSVIGPVTPGNCVSWFSTTQLKDPGYTCNNGSAASPGGSNGQVQYNNAGNFGGLTNTQLTALINTATASLSGAVPAWPSNTTTFFRGDGTYAAVAFSGITGTVSLTQGGLGGSQNAATANQIPVYPGSAGAAVPTTIAGSGGLFDAICSSTIGQIWVRASSGWGCTALGYANPVWWGADPTGSTDSASAFNSALTASNMVQFPAGTFKFASSISYTIASGLHSLSIGCAGMGQTELYWPSTNGIAVTYGDAENNSVNIHDCTITTGTAGTYTGLSLSFSGTYGNPAVAASNTITNLTFRGHDGYAVTDYWNKALSILSVSNVNVISSYFVGASAASGYGIFDASTTAAIGAVLNVSNSAFVLNNVGMSLGAYLEGVTVSQSNFTTDNTAIDVVSGNSGTGIAQLGIFNSQFGVAASGIGIHLESSVFDSAILGNLFNVAASAFAVVMENDNGPHFETNNAINCASSTTSNGVVIKGTFYNVGSNFFTGCATALDLTATAVAGVVANNYFQSSVTAILNGGATSTTIVNNGNYNAPGVACSGTPTSSFATSGGIVTHC
jgi:hypothetical protein